ncbi:MAG: glycerol-3-phosphate 1-O-acyltransferase PlsY [Deltaproteobacteria bacterium]|nr:glycerol-3-phosphate 1-O-acyltransferase PlsY [Deltaproteobacteria bacterium]MBW2617121.1 glycerol-3-phosphate 1-O-acyltransferase PlsY [Deltaproteobacteria bacterium]
MLQTFIFAIAAYLFGSIPFGKLIARKVAHIDITQKGSGNIGATNVARELSIKWGILTLVLDMLKGFVPVVLFACLAPKAGIGHEIGLSVVGLSALSGHQFSIFLKFRGGKGVGTALGIYLAISPLSCLVALMLFILIVYIWDFVSLASMISAFSMPLLFAIFGKTPPLVIGALIAAALICLKHKENIQRLLKGDERKWSERNIQANNSSSLSSSSSE